MSQPTFSVTVTAHEHAELLETKGDAAPLGADEVRGETLASLISAGTELASAYRAAKFPAHPGYAAVFRVSEVGANVRHLQIGDRALCMGPHRSTQRCAARDALRVPDGLAPEKATFARLMAVSMATLTTTTARPPSRVLVTGLGPVGHLAAQIFASCGYDVAACDLAPLRRAQAQEAGIAQVFERAPLDDPAWKGQIALALECSGHEAAALDACRIVKKRGEVVLVGVPWNRKTEIFAHEILKEVFHRYVVLRSGWEWEVPRYGGDFAPGSIEENLGAALRWLSEDRVRVDDLFALVSPRDCQAAYQKLALNQEAKLAVVFDWTLLPAP